jgi:hypothetical protein
MVKAESGFLLSDEETWAGKLPGPISPPEEVQSIVRKLTIDHAGAFHQISYFSAGTDA